MRELNEMLGIRTKLSTAFYPQTDGQTKRVNQELEQYLRMFIDHRQEQWPEWLGTAEFAYNNKAHSSTKTSPFKANYGQDPRMGFEGRKKGKYAGAEKFMEKMKDIQEEAKVALGKAQADMKKYADRKRSDIKEYKAGDLVMLSTKHLKYQMIGRRTEKLTERFVGPYKMKKIVSTNAVELELPNTVKIHPVVNVSRIRRYIGQVEGQKKEQPAPVIIEGEKEWEVERILNKRRVREKDKYLVRWKGFTAESNTWEGKENLKNAQEVIEEFEKEYRRDIEDVAWQEHKETMFKRGELPGKFTAKMLYRWSDKRYDQEYWGRLERNWKRWKGKRPARRKTMKTIPEEKEVKEEKSGVREWTEEDEDEMDNMVNPYYEL